MRKKGTPIPHETIYCSICQNPISKPIPNQGQTFCNDCSDRDSNLFGLSFLVLLLSIGSVISLWIGIESLDIFAGSNSTGEILIITYVVLAIITLFIAIYIIRNAMRRSHKLIGIIGAIIVIVPIPVIIIVIIIGNLISMK